MRTREGWLFLAVLLDACSRRIVGWATAARPTQAIAVEALTAAVRARRPAPGLVHHSDRGGSYASAEYQLILDRHGIVGSMSRPGNCFDNAPVESFFHLLKTEWLYHFTLHSRAQARSAIFDYIEGFYNRSRLHSGLGYRSPLEWRTSPAPFNPVSIFSGEHQVALDLRLSAQTTATGRRGVLAATHCSRS